MTIVIVRIDLDIYNLKQLSIMVEEEVISISEASESIAFKELSEYDKVLQVRKWQKAKEVVAI